MFERLEAKRDLLTAKIEKLLRKEVAKRRLKDFDKEKYAAYLDACLAFLDERMETYNPIGIQYTFDRISSRQAIELELQLDWYSSQAEFEELLEAARCKAEGSMTEQEMRALADELIEQLGAFPDTSIISAYEAEPGPAKMPDYIVAQAIEAIIKET